MPADLPSPEALVSTLETRGTQSFLEQLKTIPAKDLLREAQAVNTISDAHLRSNSSLPHVHIEVSEGRNVVGQPYSDLKEVRVDELRSNWNPRKYTDGERTADVYRPSMLDRLRSRIARTMDIGQ